ncbi:MAG TPA: hypothetical protein P5555_07040 [Candidatus Paceibacterota bacterium]|nr:hypothetical protein [Verrucomicrobiota bacterium]HOX02128.1 hypothetical protein [Verrucomicrobiota bacterium]HRZ44930.1 hypothetical protein [Candidatus Paceibacterota bacterium]HRZ93464.1 hypothetical protein [Candidatus Paceibacterota bacterium]
MKYHKLRRYPGCRSLCEILLAATLIGSGIAAAHADLVLRYDFDEESGDAVDSGATPPANGTFVGEAVRINDTPSGTGYALDVVGSDNAVNNYVSAGNPDKLNDLGNTITLTWWMNLKALPAQSDRVVEKLSSSAGFGVRFSAPGATTTTVALGVNTTSGAAASPTISSLDTWIFCAVTYDGSKTSQNAQWFMGSQTSPVSVSSLATYNRGPINNTTNAFRVGSTPASSSDRTPPAWFDDVRVYNAVLPMAAIEQIRIEGGGTAPSTPSVLSFGSDRAGYLAPGTDVTFTATVSGEAPLTLLWQREGTTLPGGVVTADTNMFSVSYDLDHLVPENSGLYRLLVTNMSGSVTSAPIAVHATTIFSTEVLTNLWTLDPVYFYLTNNNAERGLAYSPVSTFYPAGSLLVAHYTSLTDFGIAVLNAENGHFEEGNILSNIGISSGTRAVNKVAAAEDGAIFVGNLTTSATNVNGEYYLYRYDSDSYYAMPSIAFVGDPGAPNCPGLRWGDNLAVRGSGANTEVLIAPAGDLPGYLTWQTNIVALLRTTDGRNFTPTMIWITNGPTAFANVGLAFGPGTNTFFAKQINAPLRLMEFDVHTGLGWVKYEYDLEAIPGCVSAVALSPDATRLGALSVETPDNFRYYSITDFARAPELLDQDIFPLNYSNPTSGGVGEVAFGKNGAVYVLDSANGIKAFAPNPAYAAPDAFRITGIAPDPRGMAISWPAQPGKTYQALSSDSLTDPRWVRAGLPVTGDGSTMSATNLILGDSVNSRFYRVRGQ